MRLRIRSLIESLRYKSVMEKVIDTKAIQTKPFTAEDRKRTILMPWFGDFYSPLLPAVFKLCGYDAINLPPSDRKSVEYGLKYSNNEICYPATLIVGDFMKLHWVESALTAETSTGVTASSFLSQNHQKVTTDWFLQTLSA